MAPLQPLDTIVLWCSRGFFQGPSIGLPIYRDTAVSQTHIHLIVVVFPERTRCRIASKSTVYISCNICRWYTQPNPLWISPNLACNYTTACRFDTERNSFSCQIIWNSVITIQIWFSSTRNSEDYLSMCTLCTVQCTLLHTAKRIWTEFDGAYIFLIYLESTGILFGFKTTEGKILLCT